VLAAGIFLGAIFVVIARPKTIIDGIRCASAGLILPMCNVLMPAALAETMVFLPHVLDANVVPLDDAFGMRPSFVLGNLLAHSGSVTRVCTTVYTGVLLPIALLALAEAHSGGRVGLGALPTFLMVAASGFVIYHILPVIGPVAYFGDVFPFPTIRAHLPGPRNAMPSLHTAWVLMAFLCARGMSVTRFIIGIWLAVMLVATMGLGEHYLTDLICAVPFVLALRALCASDVPWSSTARWGGLLVGSLVLFVWGLAVRGVIHPASIPGLGPAFALFTLAVSLVWERRLAREQGLLSSSVSLPFIPSANRDRAA
jgi:hypothetical protein